MYKTIDLYKALSAGARLLPLTTSFDWWDNVYKASTAATYDREFVRRYKNFEYFDFLEADEVSDAITNFKADVLSILTLNQKKYAEIYRLFVVTDEDMPITYNYDMTETTGKQKLTDTYGGTSFTKGEQQNTDGQLTNTHNVAPFNSTTPIAESSDVKDSQTITEGARTDTSLQHIDTHENDEWTLKRKGNIGVQTAADIARIFNNFWGDDFKYMQMIFEDICKQLLMIGD